MKRIGIGLSDFKELIEEDFYYFDKTKFIDEIVKDGAKVKLFTRPRRFGKTLNMSMLKYFFDVEKKEENGKLFKDLYIEKTESFKEQGQYPVIFLSLKDLKATTWEIMEKDIKSTVSRLFLDHRYLLNDLDKFDTITFENIIMKNTNIEDYKYDLVGVISDPVEGDISINDEVLKFAKGIEIGNLFKLGTHYAEEFNLEYLDEENNTHPVVMGCYGLGIGRILAAIIEQNNDDNGMILPINIAPYKVGIVIVNTNDEESVKYANYLEEELEKVGIDVLVDNRDERCGVKFKDIDLIGIPIRVTIGRDLVNGEVELKLRNSSEVNKINTNNILFEIMKIVGKEM